MQRRFIALSVVPYCNRRSFHLHSIANLKVGITIHLSKIAIGQAYLAK